MKKASLMMLSFLFVLSLQAQPATSKDAIRKEAIHFAESEIMRFPQAWRLDHGKRLYFGYSQGLGCAAMLEMWKATNDKRYYNYVKQWADTIVNNKGEIYLYNMDEYNLDFIEPGKILFDLYKTTHTPKYKLAIETLIAQLKNHPKTTDGGYWHKKIYEHQMWLDGIYMASPFMAQYGKTFKQDKWVDEAIKQILIIHTHCYDEKTGLYYHGWDESKTQKWANKSTGTSPNFWGRSIGWYMMAITDVLDYVPAKNKQRDKLIKVLNELTNSLVPYQRGGLLYQVVDQPERAGNYAEASVNSQCMYSIAKAVNKGYLPKEKREIALNIYKGIQQQLIKVNACGSLSLRNCCAVAGLGGTPYRDGSYDYYIHERIRDNDTKATGPYIMGCLELSK